MRYVAPRADGYYDETGHWQRLKFCFVSCGAACTCMPPLGLFYSEAHDTRKQQPETNPGDKPPERCRHNQNPATCDVCWATDKS